MAGALKAVILDWAGTVVDFGSQAPMGAFVEAFGRFDVAITIAEARIPMGLPKRDHVAAVLALPRVSAAWAAVHGAPPGEADVDAVYAVFVPINEAVVTDFATLIPGAAAAVADARSRGLKIGSTTGYTRSIMARLAPAAAAQGYVPDSLVCADDLPAGRPTPLMMYKSFVDLAVWPAAACVKVDDTVPGLAEGLAAGSWTVGVAVSGNGVGLSPAAWAGLADAERQALRTRAAAELTAAGAHVVIDTIADLPACLDGLSARLAAGGRP